MTSVMVLLLLLRFGPAPPALHPPGAAPDLPGDAVVLVKALSDRISFRQPVLLQALWSTDLKCRFTARPADSFRASGRAWVVTMRVEGGIRDRHAVTAVQGKLPVLTVADAAANGAVIRAISSTELAPTRHLPRVVDTFHDGREWSVTLNSAPMITDGGITAVMDELRGPVRWQNGNAFPLPAGTRPFSNPRFHREPEAALETVVARLCDRLDFRRPVLLQVIRAPDMAPTFTADAMGPGPAYCVALTANRGWRWTQLRCTVTGQAPKPMGASERRRVRATMVEAATKGYELSLPLVAQLVRTSAGWRARLTPVGEAPPLGLRPGDRSARGTGRSSE